VLTVAANESASTLTVTAKSDIDQTKSDTATVTIIVFSGPLVVTIPSLIRTGDTVTAEHVAVPGVTYRWRRLNEFAPSSQGSDISGATGKNYTTVAADEGKYIEVVATLGNSSYSSNRVYVRAVSDPAPVVTSITVSVYADAEVTKGGSLTLQVTVEGDNLSSSDKTVIWEVNSTTQGTYIVTSGFMVVSNILFVSYAETASTLTVKATSVITPAVSGELEVTVNEAEGKSVTITGITGLDGKYAYLEVIDDEGETVAEGEGRAIISGTVSFGLLDTNDPFNYPRQVWDGEGEHLLVLSVENNFYRDRYIYTNGQTLNANLADNPKYNFTSGHSNIPFNLFKKFPIGEGGHALSISGFNSSDNGEDVELFVLDDKQVAYGYGTISNGSVTVTLIDDADGISGWTAGGNFKILFRLGGWKKYLYTNGQELDDLGITNDFEFSTAPDYTFTAGAGPSTITLDKFKVLEFFGPFITITGMGDLGEGTQVTLVLVDSYYRSWNDVQADGSAEFEMGGWDGNGSCAIKLTVYPNIYVYTGGQSLTALGVTSWDDLYENLPLYDFDTNGLEIAFSHFVLVDLPLPTVTITGMGTDFEGEEWTISLDNIFNIYIGNGTVTDGSVEFGIQLDWDGKIWDETGSFLIQLIGSSGTYVYIADKTLAELGISTVGDLRTPYLPRYNFGTDGLTIDFSQFGGPLFE
jgi:hypothetical protein